MIQIDDWQSLVNKPVIASDGIDVGVVSDIEPERILVTWGPVTPDKFIIPKSSVERIEKGVVYLKETGDTVREEYMFE
jgi:hypothetical protein